MKLCSRCKVRPRRSPKQRYCNDCHAAYMRETAKPYAALSEEAKIKRRARSAACHAVERGELEPQPCCVCGSMEDLEKHHEDYSKPLEVQWYCRPHHVELELTRRGHAKAA